SNAVDGTVGDYRDWTRVAPHGLHTCGLRQSGTLYCWGANEDGQLGDGTRQDRHVPTRVSFDGPLADVATGGAHTCALDAAGALYCWGRNSEGQLGLGTSWDAVPAAVADEVP